MNTITQLSPKPQAPCICFLQELDISAERLDLLALYSLDEARRHDGAGCVIEASRCRMEAVAFKLAATCLRKQMVSATVSALLPGIAEESVTNAECEIIAWRPVLADASPDLFLTASGVLIEEASRRSKTEAAALRYAATVLLQEKRADSQALAA